MDIRKGQGRSGTPVAAVRGVGEKDPPGRPRERPRGAGRAFDQEEDGGGREAVGSAPPNPVEEFPEMLHERTARRNSR